MSKVNQLQKSFGQVIIFDGSVTKLGSTSAVTLTATPSSIIIPQGETTLAASQLLAGIIGTGQDEFGGNNTDNTILHLPSANDLVGAFSSAKIGDTFTFSVINLSPPGSINYTTTVLADQSGTLVGNGVISPGYSTTFSLRFTNVDLLLSSYTVYAVSSALVVKKTPVPMLTGEVLITVSQLLSGCIPTGGTGGVAIQLPAASDIISLFPSTQINDTINFSVINLAPDTYDTVVTADPSGTLVGNGTIAPLHSVSFSLVLDPNTPAYTVYALSSVV